jgi:hypothetical protein
MSSPNLFTDGEQFDTFVILSKAGRVTLPGWVEVSVSGGIKSDSGPVPGQDGVSRTLLGYAPAKVSVACNISQPDEYDKLKEIIRLFKPTKPRDPKTYKPEEFECIYPILEIFNISRLFIMDIKAPAYKLGDEWTVTFEMEEWWPTESGKVKTGTKKTNAVGANGLAPGEIPITGYVTAYPIAEQAQAPDLTSNLSPDLLGE